MKKLLLISVLLSVLCYIDVTDVFSQASFNTAIGVTCAADGSSTQVFAAKAGRYSYSVINDSATDVRIGFLSGSSTADLTDANSYILKAGASYADSVPGVYSGRVVCMSTTASTAVIHATESYR